MRLMLLTIFLNGIFLCAFGQRQTSQWFLNGNRIAISPAGVSTLPQPGSNSRFNPKLGSTSVSDEAGTLLFACDGQTIIDKNLAEMPALKNARLESQNDKILAVNIPNSLMYYIFYASANGYGRNDAWTLKYAIVDLALNGGLGDVVEYNKVVATDVSQGFTLAQDPDSDDCWLVSHQQATTAFRAYKISSAGLSKTPVVSNAGSNPITNEYIFKDLKTSPDGTMIAGIAYRDYTDIFARAFRFMEVFNFDLASGMLTSKVRTPRSFEYFYFSQTLEFSANGRMVYLGSMQRIFGLQPCGWGGGFVTQYNLCYTDSTDFARFSMRVAEEYNRCASSSSWARIQMAANKQIYMPHSGNFISSIANPNRIGSSSNFTYNAIELTTHNNSEVVTPTFHQGLLQTAIANNIVYEGGCFPKSVHFKITNPKITNIAWNFGDAASGSNLATSAMPQHVFSAPGFYTVKAQLYNASGQLMETLTELVEIKNPSKRLLAQYPTDTIFCSGNSMRVKLQVVNGIFNWVQKNENGVLFNRITADSIEITSSGMYYVEMRQNDCNGCILKDSIRVVVLPTPYVNLGYDQKLCTGDSLELQVNDPSGKYIWSTGDTTTTIHVRKGGIYWVEGEFNRNGCPQRDSILIQQVPGIAFNLPADTLLCSGQTIMLTPNVTNASYAWQDGSSNPNFLVNEAGKYWARLTNGNGCTRSDTVQVSYIDAQQVNLGNDTALCRGESLQLRVNIANATVAWSTGATTQSIVVKKSGAYWVRVNNGSCIVTDTVTVQFGEPPTVSLGTDITLCEKETRLLKPGVRDAAYLWQDGSANDFFIVEQPGLYWLQVRKDGCLVRDSVTVTYKPLPAVSLGNDTSVCVGSTLLIDAYSPTIKSYTWQNNTTRSSLLVNRSGTYWVTAIGLNGCANTDSILVNEAPVPVFSLGNDTTLCETQLLTLAVNKPNAMYKWNDASVLNNVVVQKQGVYWLQVTQAGCSKRDSIVVRYKPLPLARLGSDTVLCEGATKLLDAFNTAASYKWNTGATTPSINITKPGAFSVAVTKDGCSVADTVIINYLYLPRFTLGKDTGLCLGQSFVLDPKISTGRFLWQDGSVASKYTVSRPGTYTVTITNNCGTAMGRIVVNEGLCELVMPNVFTANRDGLNDVFGVKYPQFIKTFKMQVFDRWGQIVYSSSDPQKGWDGTFRNHQSPVGHYVWQILLTDNKGRQQNAKGTVLLLR